MRLHFTEPVWLWLLLPAFAWTIWLFVKSDVHIGKARRWIALALRSIVLLFLIFAIAGVQVLKSKDGVNVFYVLDRSESIPPAQQEAARMYVNESSEEKQPEDAGGVIVFGGNTGIEFNLNKVVQLEQVQAVVSPDATDLAGAIRLATAAFPEAGQKRIVILSDGNENVGDAIEASIASRSMDVSIDVIPLGAERKNDVVVKELQVPPNLKKGQTFDAKIFIESELAQRVTMRIYRNDEFLGEQAVELEAGKNLFSFPQTLENPGFYDYEVKIEARGDAIIQNNEAVSYTTIQGDPRVLIISENPEADQMLASVLRDGKLDVRLVGVSGFPETLAEMQSYDSIILSNVAAGEKGREEWRLLESAIRDFGVGFVCIGGDQSFTAGGYRGTPLEDYLPVSMELDSKKVLPRGALALVMHGMEFNNGNQVARDVAIGALDALGPEDEMGVLLWDGSVRWLFELQKVGDKRALGQQINGMNQGDLPDFQRIMELGYDGLKKSTANIKHMIVFSDGDPGAPTQQLMDAMVGDKITVSTVLISGHAGPQTMIQIAEQGRGRFYNVTNPNFLPQIFLKETAVILKSAIFENPFLPQLVSSSETVRGLDGWPTLLGYVATTLKDRADTPLMTDKGDPLLAHWQYGLGRSVAFTSDARSKWAQGWQSWGAYSQFWNQVVQWSLRKVDASDFQTEIEIDNGEGFVAVEALDGDGNFRNFLTLQTVVVDPKGERQLVYLDQVGPGRYEGRFDTRDVGTYQLNVLDLQDGVLRGSQSVGASVSYSPEFNATEPNLHLLNRLVDIGGGRIVNPALFEDNPFVHDRKETYQPVDLWEQLLKLAVILFVIDIAIRRVSLDRDQIAAVGAFVRRCLFLAPREAAAPDQRMGSLLSKKREVQTDYSAAKPGSRPREELFNPAGDLDETTAPPEVRATSESRSTSPAASPEPDSAPASEEDDSPAARLLRAKKRAQNWKNDE